MPWGQIPAGVSDTHGFLAIDKDPGVTSHDCVSALRRLLGTRKIGHAGTLDPMATGLLVIGVGRATKLLQYALGQPKRYTATVCLGAGSTTDDADGRLTPGMPGAIADGEEALAARVDAWFLEHSHRDILQRPSAVSAIKRDGVRAYERVRAGEAVELDARPVHIYSMTRTSAVRFVSSDALRGVWEEGSEATQGLYALFDIDVTVSAGTYIRALARDLGEHLSCGGHLQALRRESIGPWAAGMTIRDLSDHLLRGGRLPLITIEELCGDLFAPVTLDERQCREISYGKFLEVSVLERDAQGGQNVKRQQNVTLTFSEATQGGQVPRPWAAYYHGHVVALLEAHRLPGGKQVLKPALFFTAPEALRELERLDGGACPLCGAEEPQWHLRENTGHVQKKNNNV